MCLDKLSNFKIGCYKGWQFFRKEKGKLYPVACDFAYEEAFKRKTVPVGVWEKDKNCYDLVTIDKEDFYQTGFHIFLSKSEAEKIFDFVFVEDREKTELRKVRFRKIVARGYIRGVKTVVVRERMVLPA